MVSLELEARLNNLLSSGQAETADIDLFTPIADREECPICLIPLPFRDDEIVYKICCGKQICDGCNYKNYKNDLNNGVSTDEMECAFCRQLTPMNTTKALKKLMKKNNTYAFMAMAFGYESGTDGLFQSDTKSLEMRIRAAELGSAKAFTGIGQDYDSRREYFYEEGSVVKRDMSKALAFWEIAAKKGDIVTRGLLIAEIWDNHGSKMLIKHLKVIASAGDKELDKLMQFYSYRKELLSKEELTQTLRAYQVSSNEMKSKDRDDARAAWGN